MISVEEAKAIVRLIGKPLLKFAASITAPLFWVGRDSNGTYTRNGTAFFLQTKEALFGVTAAHVIEGPMSWREHCDSHGRTPLVLGGREGSSVHFDWDARAVDINSGMDIATFMVSPNEVAHLDRNSYSGYQAKWPPDAPKENQGIIFCGFPAIDTHRLSHDVWRFGAACGSGVVGSISERDVSSLIERDYLEPALGEGVPPENFNFGGISGAPMLYVTLSSSGLFLNDLAGVIVSGPNTSNDPSKAISGFEVIRARRARFIRSDGSLDHTSWDRLGP